MNILEIQKFLRNVAQISNDKVTKIMSILEDDGIPDAINISNMVDDICAAAIAANPLDQKVIDFCATVPRKISWDDKQDAYEQFNLNFDAAKAEGFDYIIRQRMKKANVTDDTALALIYFPDSRTPAFADVRREFNRWFRRGLTDAIQADDP